MTDIEKIGRGLGPVQHISGRFTVLVRYSYGTCTGKSTIDERMRDHLLRNPKRYTSHNPKK